MAVVKLKSLVFKMYFFITYLTLNRCIPACPSLCVCTTNKRGIVINCSNSRLQELPHIEAPSDTVELNLSNNNITSYDGGYFLNLTNLRKLDISGNGLTVLVAGGFQVLAKLEVLNLSRNVIEQLDPQVFVGLTNLRQLLLYNNRISHLPDIIFHNLTELSLVNLTHNKLTKISSQLFSKSERLWNLDVSSNDFDMLDADAFEKTTSLSSLDLRRNKLTALRKGTFSSLNRLRHLYLSFNNISHIEDEVFGNESQLIDVFLDHNRLKLKKRMFSKLSTLFELYLDSNEIDKIPRGTFENSTKLRKLSLNNNNIETIGDEELQGLESLEQLLVSTNKLRNVSLLAFPMLKTVDVSNNTQLQQGVLFNNNSRFNKINLSYNNLKEIPATILELWWTVYKLNLSNNAFDHIPNFHGLKLDVLDMSHNNLKEISFINASHVEHLILRKNRISNLSNVTFRGLKRLHELDLSNNELVTLSEIPYEVHELIGLDFSNNKINFIPGMVFKNLFKLSRLDLSNNNISSLNKTIFRGLIHLKKLNLKGNEITKLSEGLSCLTKLTHIDLSENRIEELRETMFSTQSLLETLTLRSNRLSHVPFGFMKNNPKLVYLDMRLNLFTNCSCDLPLFIHSLPHTNILGECQFNSSYRRSFRELKSTLPDLSRSNCDICLLRICRNQGLCFLSNNSRGFHCACSSNFTGSICEVDKRICFHNQSCGLCDHGVCLNNGTCKEISMTLFSCKCKPGFTGRTCGEKLTPCNAVSTPCQKHGKCIVSSSGRHFSCLCELNYTGVHCQTRLPPVCSSNHCMHGATCRPVDPQKTRNYTCICRSGFNGTRCENHPCLNVNCSGKGICLVFNSTDYRCNCTDGRYGNNCEHKTTVRMETDSKKLSKWIYVFITTAIAFLLIMAVMTILYVRKKRKTQSRDPDIKMAGFSNAAFEPSST